MVLCFASRPEDDPHIESIRRILQKKGVAFKLINPHDVSVAAPSLISENGQLSLMLNGAVIDPEVVFMSTQWRTDCIIDFPDSEIYPAAFRSSVEQLLQDIRFTFNHIPWLPGRIEDIERAESKPLVLRVASTLGLRVPRVTMDAFPWNIGCSKHPVLYRKALGPPFTISLNVNKGIEVGLTVTNVIHDSSQAVMDRPWQFQEVIRSRKQIRCCVVGQKVWSVEWQRDPDGADFRFLNEVQDQSVEWHETILPSPIAEKLIGLNRKLNLAFSCPEFLVDEEGEYILIDLNPCGDWYGFFPDSVHEDIAGSFAELVLSYKTKKSP